MGRSDSESGTSAPRSGTQSQVCEPKYHLTIPAHQLRQAKEVHMPKHSARERLADAALALFEESGYEPTTVDDIAERAGVGRSTFFRHFRSKEDVIFPDHEALRAQVA